MFVNITTINFYNNYHKKRPISRSF